MIEKYKIEDKINEVQENIADECSKEYVEKVKEHVGNVCSIEGKFNRNKMWKLKKKLLPRNLDKATAKKDKDGNLITHPAKLKKVYIDYYQDLLKH